MKLPDPEGSRAVLVGSYAYRALEPLPAVANNIARLRELLTSPDLLGLPPRYCQAVPNASGPAEVLDVIHQAAAEASDTLLVYYAGHGLVDPNTDELYLALPESSSERLYNAIRFEDLRREMVMVARAPSRVVILDCCYSGRAMIGGMSGSMEMADQARIDGTYLMTASADTVRAQAPVGDEFTAFTSELVTALDEGVPDGPDLLNMETIYWHVRGRLVARRRPIPQQRAGNDGGMIVLTRNRRGVRSDARQGMAQRELPEPPPGAEHLMRRPPREIAAEAARLAGLGRADEATQLLTAAAVRRPDQEVAALISLLRGGGRGSEADLVVSASAQRPAGEITAIANALGQIGLPRDADQVLDAVAQGSPADVGAVAEALNAKAAHDKLRRLLDAAVAAHRRPEDVIALVGTLSSIGLGHEINSLLDLAAEGLTVSETAALADSLRGAGRETAAFRLYTAALEAVARRPADVIASLLRAMRDASQDEYGDRLLDAVCAEKYQPDEVTKLALALWSVSLGNEADRLLESAASAMDVGQVAALAGSLREADRSDAALRLCVRAAARQSAAAALELVQALRDAGRPVDGNHVLESSHAWPAGKAAELVTLLRDAGGDADADRVLAACSRPEAGYLGELVAALRSHKSDEDAYKVIARASSGPSGEAWDLAVELHRRNLDHDADQVLIAAAADSTESFCEVLAALQDKQLTWQTNRLLEWKSGQNPAEVLDSLVALRQRNRAWSDELLTYFLRRPIADIARLVDLLTANRSAFGAGAIAAALARQRSVLLAFRHAGLHGTAGELLRTAAEQMKDDEILDFYGVLEKERRRDDADYLIVTALPARPVSFASKLLSHADGIVHRQAMQTALQTFAAQRPADDIKGLAQVLRQHGYAAEARQLRRQARRP